MGRSGKAGKEGLVVVYKGEVLASGDAKTVRNSLDEVFGAKGTALTTNLENSYLRVNALRRWGDKFKVKFHLHFDGEFKLNLSRNVQLIEGTGGHNHSVIGENIRVRKYLTTPKDNLPFDALISVRYSVRERMGRWIEKKAKSSMFPKNWDITRVKQEIALVYDDMVESGYTLRFENNKWRRLVSNKQFEILIEVDKQGNITNAYPLKK